MLMVGRNSRVLAAVLWDTDVVVSLLSIAMGLMCSFF